MAYTTLSVVQAIERIAGNQLFLPALQRNFVWDRKRIEQYFDSLYKGFPLGNFIFWNLSDGLANKYPLYLFTKEYNERNHDRNPKPPRNLLNGKQMWAVVDGQQRLSSLYIGLTGTYEYKKPGKGLKDIAHNFISSRLYFNLMHVDKRYADENEPVRIFSFKSLQEASHVNDKSLWLEVGRILNCKSETDVNSLIKELTKLVKGTAKKSVIQKYNDRLYSIKENVLHLYYQFTTPRLNYFEVNDQDIDEVIEIFVRVNSGGMQLKKADLLFSTIAAEWNEARDKIDALLDSLEEYDLYVDRDFVMRAALMLSDLPVKYKVETFNKKNIKTIIGNWDKIETSLLRLAENLNQFGYKYFPNLSSNALIPIAYFISKGGDIKTQQSLKSIRLYYVTSQVKNLFGGQNDIVLSRVREALRSKSGGEYGLKNSKFDFDSIRSLELPIRKSFKIDKNYIEAELADERYGANAYFLLSILYPSVDFKMKRFELDHIHPKRRMNPSHLRSLGLQDLEVEWILEHYDNLPNLELLTSEDNIAKKAKPFEEFIMAKGRKEKMRFLGENFIPADRNMWKLENFRAFYESRRKTIVKKLVKAFEG